MQDGLIQNNAPRDARGQAARVRALMAPSLEKQRISVLQQSSNLVESARAEERETGSGSFFATARLSMPAPFAMPACDPVPKPQLFQIIQAAAQQEGVDPALVREVARQESAFRPCAVSTKGAEGLMQLMPATQAQFDVTDPFDPGQSIDAGTKLLKQLLDRYHGDLSLALSAYNSGAGRVDKAGGIPDIPETKNYVFSILNRFLQ
jgi:soluble lytic murein transglycosylase-like protein